MSTLPVSSYEDPTLEDKMQAKYEASVLARQADFEGWSDDKLTRALNYHPAARIPSENKPAAVTSEESSNNMGSEQVMRLQKRQETIRVTRQAEMEGWSDEKLVAALRLRNSIHYELRSRVLEMENP